MLASDPPHEMKIGQLHNVVLQVVVDHTKLGRVTYQLKYGKKQIIDSQQRCKDTFGHATNVAIRPLDEEKAVQAAADLIGELFVFTVAAAAVTFEVQRSSRSEARKEEMRIRELQEMKQKDEEIAREVELLKQKLEELEQLVKERGLAGFFNFRHGHVLKDEK
ncbi:hypothetical protein GH714_031166 [Hevea brasiliensis]|uniref:OPA3-like protein n=1 Tax=Hevea brasiliensis TaxID=3981 RepID=A0A6A6L4M3_HEVBR|nr:hypothetical protein GH714_031166 [Hevea brasiliensis]